MSRMSHLGGKGKTFVAEGTVWATTGESEAAGTKAWLALVDASPTGHFLTRVAFEPSCLWVIQLTCIECLSFFGYYPRRLSYIREWSKNLLLSMPRFSFLFPTKLPLPIAFFMANWSVRVMRRRMGKHGNIGDSHSIKCVMRWVPGRPHTCVWLTDGDQRQCQCHTSSLQAYHLL